MNKIIKISLEIIIHTLIKDYEYSQRDKLLHNSSLKNLYEGRWKKKSKTDCDELLQKRYDSKEI